jgi:hypothetical protein
MPDLGAVMDEYTVEFDETTGEWIASTPVEDYCTPVSHLAYLWLAQQIQNSEGES